MDLKIGQTIARLRRERGITQEQLANAIGVSVAAVSKWETGQTCPDIALLPAIAEYFTVSIDALMDFRISERYAQLEEIKAKLSEYRRTGDFNAALPVAMDALSRYPNDFDLMLSAANFLFSKGTSGIPEDEKAEVLKECMRYLQAVMKACPEERMVNEAWDLLANVYHALGEYDKAIDALEKISKGDDYWVKIAGLKFKKGDIIGAKGLLQLKLAKELSNFPMLCGTLADCYRSENNMEAALECGKFNAKVIELLTGDKPNHFDMVAGCCYYELAETYYQCDDYDGALKALERAVYHAVRFDENPSYVPTDGVKFFDCLTDSYYASNSPGNVSYGLLKGMEKNFPKLHGRKEYTALIARLKEKAATKQETGYWQ